MQQQQLEDEILSISQANENLPKIEVLKLAINYIALLRAQSQGQEFTSDEEILMLSVNLKNSTIKMLARVLRH